MPHREGLHCRRGSGVPGMCKSADVRCHRVVPTLVFWNRSEALIELSRENGLPFWLAAGEMCLARTIAGEGESRGDEAAMTSGYLALTAAITFADEIEPSWLSSTIIS